MGETAVAEGRPASGPAVPLLQLQNVEVIYDEVILVLRGLSMEVGDGRIIALLGSNGAGKTTTLKAISGLLPSEHGEVTDGDVLYDGRSIARDDPAALVRAGISLVMEGRRVFEHLTVHENLIAGAYTRPGSPAAVLRSRTKAPAGGQGGRSSGSSTLGEDLDRIYGYFPRLADRRNQQAGYLSGGEQQMLAIGRSLMAQPRLMMLDEPSLGLAPLLVDEIFGIVRRLNEELGTTILLVEQNARRALEIAHQGYIMETGRIVLEGPAAELSANPDVQEFYLGLGEQGQRRSYRDVKSYKRRKRWL